MTQLTEPATRVTDQSNQTRNRAYEYDKLGRLKRAKGGTGAFYTPQWAQIYSYDRYGNRASVVSDPTLPALPSNIPLDGLASLGLSAIIEFNIFASSATHFIVDVTGYFAP